jgi:hypothetical protein
MRVPYTNFRTREGDDNASDDNDPFEVSDADTMIKYLKENAG